MALAVAQFVFFAAVIVGAGSILARHADVIAEVTGLGRLVVGSILLAGATSLPEFSVDVSAIRQNTPNLAVGDLLGSGLMNLLILAVLDFTRYSPGVMFSRTAASHALSATVSIGLTAIASIALLAERHLGDRTFIGLGFGAWLLVLGYLYGVRLVFMDQRISARAAKTAQTRTLEGQPPSLARSLIFFIIGATIILVAGPQLAGAAAEIARLSGLGTTFVGTTLVAISTSLPELVACLAAVRLGAFDLAVGNVFGSNAFNMAILATLDFWQPGSLFAVAAPEHALTGLCIVLATSAAVVGQLYHMERRTHWFERDALAVGAIVLVSLWLVYALTS